MSVEHIFRVQTQGELDSYVELEPLGDGRTVLRVAFDDGDFIDRHLLESELEDLRDAIVLALHRSRGELRYVPTPGSKKVKP